MEKLIEHLKKLQLSVIKYGPDSLLIQNAIKKDDADNYFERILEDTDWRTMNHKGGKVPRLISIQHTLSKDKDDNVLRPVYRHPADVQPTPEEWGEFSGKVNKLISKLLGFPFNHGLIQQYRNGDDYIREHADKTLDIKLGTPIVNVSLGRTRTMKLRSKFKQKDGTRIIQDVRLTHGSVFILGPMTNKTFTHSIRVDKRCDKIKREDELAFDGVRISLTLRQIATFMTHNGKLIGQGAPKQDIDTNVKNKESINDCEQMLIAFGTENKSFDYEWNDIYGKGFHSLNFKEL